MAGIALIARNASFDNAREILPPVTDGLLGWYYPRESAERAVINYAPDGIDGALFGNPVITAGYMEAESGSKFLQTAQAETAEFTWLLAAQNTDTLASAADQPSLMGNYNGASGGSMYISNDTAPLPAGRLRGQAYTSTNNNRALVLSNVNKWQLYAVVLSATELGAYSLTDGLSQVAAVSGARAVGANPLRIGSIYSTGFLGTSRIAMAAIYDRALTAGELAELKGFIAYDLSHVGITV